MGEWATIIEWIQRRAPLLGIGFVAGVACTLLVVWG